MNFKKWLVVCAVFLMTALGASSAWAQAFQCNGPPGGNNAIGADTQDGHLAAGPTGTCGAPNAAPGIDDAGTAYAYKKFTFRNRTGADACVTVNVAPNAQSKVTAAAYSTFDPANITSGYLGDLGGVAGNGLQSFSFDVTANAAFDVVITEATAGGGGTFVVNVTNCGTTLVTSVTPSFGPTAGGTTVSVNGSGFFPGATVSFGGIAATNVVFFDEFTITATTPAGAAAGAVDVTVLNTNGTTATLAGGFTYYDPITSSVTLSADVDPSVYGQMVTFTAHVDISGPPPSGTVQFKVDGVDFQGPVAVDGVTGDAMLATADLDVGNHSIDANYTGDTIYSAAASNTLSHDVNPADTTTTISSSSSPSVFGQNVVFTVHVAANAPGGGTPTGDVTLSVDGTQLGAAKALDGSGNVTFETSMLAIGDRAIDASYAGVTRYNSSNAATLTQTVTKDGTTVTVASSQPTATFGTTVTFTATVANTQGGTPTGTVTFKDGSTPITNCSDKTLDNMGKATCSTAALTVGSHTINVDYGGDADNNTASGAKTQVITSAATTTTLASSVNPSTPGQSVTFTATVASTVSGTISGNVTFKDGTTTLGTQALDSMKKATLATTTLAVGTHPITAVYAGAGDFATSTSATLNQVVSTTPDAGVDAGPDSGTTPDSGTSSSSSSSSGSTTSSSGAPADAGVTPPASEDTGGGCDCRAAGGDGYGSVAAALGVLAFVASRRRRRDAK